MGLFVRKFWRRFLSAPALKNNKSNPMAGTLAQEWDEQQARSSWIGRMGVTLYGKLGSERLLSRLRNRVIASEGGPAFSHSIRLIFSRYHRVHVGLYTAGPCGLRPNVFHAGTSIGRYTLIADSLRTFTRNHPMNIMSTHGFFYNPALGIIQGAPIQFNELKIGNGVCIGHNAVVLPPTQSIGDGAIIMPGAVVFFNVPAYSIVSGCPATVKGYRFPKEQIPALVASEWWKKTPDELGEDHRSLIESYIGKLPGAGTNP